MNTIKASKNSILFPNFPHDVSTQIIWLLDKDDSSLNRLSLVSKAICVFLEVNKETCFTPKALTRKTTYRNIIKIFKTVDKYLEMPIYSDNLISRAKMGLPDLHKCYLRCRSRDKENKEFVHLVTIQYQNLGIGQFAFEQENYDLSDKDNIKKIIAIKRKFTGCTLF